MATAEVRHELFGHAEHKNYLTHSHGFASWAFTLDHKRIGIMYLIGVSFALILAGIFALALRTHLYFHDSTFLSLNWLFGEANKLNINQVYNQMFTLHGAIMVFSFIIPSIPAALGNMVLPMMLGAKDVAFPRLNLLSFYLWVFGTGFLLVALVNGGLDTGWTFYTPYSIETSTGVVYATFGAFVLVSVRFLPALISSSRSTRCGHREWVGSGCRCFYGRYMPLRLFKYWRPRFWESRCCCSWPSG